MLGATLNTRAESHGGGGLASLRRFVDPVNDTRERCGLCGVPLAEGHDHLVNPAERRMVCACPACAVLFSHRARMPYRRVPRDVIELDPALLGHGRWEMLDLPVNLAFFFRSSVASTVIAVYPSPAGAMESTIDLAQQWGGLVVDIPQLDAMEPDTQAHLVQRAGQGARAYIAPIDACYRLVGVVRTQWRGLSGGDQVQRAIDAVFEDLAQRSAAGRPQEAPDG